jgi:hypothetical protein
MRVETAAGPFQDIVGQRLERRFGLELGEVEPSVEQRVKRPRLGPAPSQVMPQRVRPGVSDIFRHLQIIVAVEQGCDCLAWRMVEIAEMAQQITPGDQRMGRAALGQSMRQIVREGVCPRLRHVRVALEIEGWMKQRMRPEPEALALADIVDCGQFRSRGLGVLSGCLAPIEGGIDCRRHYGDERHLGWRHGRQALFLGRGFIRGTFGARPPAEDIFSDHSDQPNSFAAALSRYPANRPIGCGRARQATPRVGSPCTMTCSPSLRGSRSRFAAPASSRS